MFTNAGATGAKGPTLSQVKNVYSSADWTKYSDFLNMINDNGIQLWTVPITGSYTIQAAGAGVPYNNNYTSKGMSQYQKGMNVSITTQLTKGEVIKILVGHVPVTTSPHQTAMGGAGGTFVIRESQTPIIVAGGGGGRGASGAQDISNAITNSSGQSGKGYESAGAGGSSGGGGGGAVSGGSGGGDGEVGLLFRPWRRLARVARWGRRHTGSGPPRERSRMKMKSAPRLLQHTLRHAIDSG